MYEVYTNVLPRQLIAIPTALPETPPSPKSKPVAVSIIMLKHYTIMRFKVTKIALKVGHTFMSLLQRNVNFITIMNSAAIHYQNSEFRTTYHFIPSA